MIHHTVTTAIAGRAQVSLVTGSKPMQADQTEQVGCQPAVRQIHQAPDQRDDGHRQHRRAEEYRAQHRAAAQRVVQRERQEQPEYRRRPASVSSTNITVLRTVPRKIASSSRLREIVEPDAAVPAAEHVVVLERQPNAEAERDEQQDT